MVIKVSALVTLYSSQEDTEAASDILNDAVQWYEQNNVSITILSCYAF